VNLLSPHYMEMIMEELQSDNLKRFERKYVLSQNRSWIFRNILSEKRFIKIHNKRRVRSLYFDTLNFSFFRDNIEGVSNRIKPRIRWYEEAVKGKNKEFEARLEFKKKKGFVGTKTIYSLGKFKNITKLLEIVNQEKFLNRISVIIKQNVFPVLITSYNREYFISYNKKFRSTIDTNLSVQSVVNNKIKLPIDKEILELKYGIENDNDFRNNIINSNFKLRFQKFSKYSVGLLNLKKNGLI